MGTFRSASRSMGTDGAQLPADVAASTTNIAANKARDHDHPGDNAFYHCTCGLDFTAEVSAAAPCPSCGSGQPW